MTIALASEPAVRATTGHLDGYARVSTHEQDAALQRDALTASGRGRIWEDVASGETTSRPLLDAMLEALPQGDAVVVWRLDRLGRSLAHLISTIDDFTARGLGFRSLREAMDTTTAAGRLTLGIFAILAEFGRSLIRERTVAGLEAARSRGSRIGGPTVVTPTKLAAARALLAGGATVSDAATAVGISRPTLYRHLQAAEVAR